MHTGFHIDSKKSLSAGLVIDLLPVSQVCEKMRAQAEALFPEGVSAFGLQCFNKLLRIREGLLSSPSSCARMHPIDGT
jgi:hypothetical protein